MSLTARFHSTRAGAPCLPPTLAAKGEVVAWQVEGGGYGIAVKIKNNSSHEIKAGACYICFPKVQTRTTNIRSVQIHAQNMRLPLG